MKWINCKNCGHEFSSKLSKCPECGRIHLTVKALITSICIIALVVASGIGIVLGVMDKENFAPTIQEDNSLTETTSNEENTGEKDNKKEGVSSHSTSSSKNENSSVSSSKTQQVSEPKKDTSSIKDTTISDEELVVKERNYPVGTRLEGDCYYTTIPKCFLDFVYNLSNEQGDFDEFAYTLSSEDKKAGFQKIYRNPNGAATFVLPYNKKSSVTVEWLTGMLEYIAEIKRLDYIVSVEHNKDFDEFDIVINCNDDEITAEQESQILLFGLYGIEYQYHKINGANECIINLEYANGVKENLKMSEIIQIAEG